MIDYSVAVQQFEIFILVLMRIASFAVTAPFFSMANTPQRTRLGFALFFSLLIYPLLLQPDFVYTNVVDYAILVVKECAVGIMLGLAPTMVIQIIQFAGKIIDMDIGLSMATIYDPQSHNQVGIIGTLYYYALMLMLIVTGLYQYLVRAIAETFTLIPLGNVNFRPSLYGLMLGFMKDYMVIGFRIALPIFSTTLLLNCILAILAKVAPQMNMFVIGVQLKIMGGIVVLMAVIYLFPSAVEMINIEIEKMMKGIVGGLM